MTERPRVLLCDEQPQTLPALRVTLRGAGFEVDLTATAGEPLDHVTVGATNHPDYQHVDHDRPAAHDQGPALAGRQLA